MARRQLFVERIAHVTIFTLAAFWIVTVFLYVFQPTVTDATPLHPQNGLLSKGSLDLSTPRRQQQQQEQHSQELVPTRAAGVVPQVIDHDHVHPGMTLPKYLSPLIIFTCKRADYLKETLNQVLDYMPKTCAIGCPLIISQDGHDEAVAKVVKIFQERFEDVIPIIHLQHESSNPGGIRGAAAYKALSVHYGWALQQLFRGLPEYPPPERVIILEEDLHISPDFFEYFAYTAPLLDQDETLLAVSAFNDNGKKGMVKDTTRILRSDFFPGLGWMMTKKLWDTELSAKWPTGYWDDWLREPVQRQSRHILRPEVSRTYHFGVKDGASGNQFGDNLSSIHLNDEKVQWSTVNLSYLNPMLYDKMYFELVSMALLAQDLKAAIDLCKTQNVRLEYSSLIQFQNFAKKLNIMTDEKAGIPRTAYRSVVEIRPHGDFILFLTPPMEKLKLAFHYR